MKELGLKKKEMLQGQSLLKNMNPALHSWRGRGRGGGVVRAIAELAKSGETAARRQPKVTQLWVSAGFACQASPISKPFAAPTLPLPPPASSFIPPTNDSKWLL